MTTYEYYNSLSFEELKQIATLNGIETDGSRVEIIQRLINNSEYLFQQNLQQQQVALQQAAQQYLQPFQGEEQFRQLQPHQLNQQPLQIQQPIKPQCMYGLACYRKNPIHFTQFNHPQQVIQRFEKEQEEIAIKEAEFEKQKGTIVAPDIHFPDQNYHIYNNGTYNFNSLLNKVSIENNLNKFYIIQLLESLDGNQYSVWIRKGKVGEIGKCEKHDFNDSELPLGNALSMFTTKFLEKTSNSFFNKDNFQKVEGSYQLIEIDEYQPPQPQPPKPPKPQCAYGINCYRKSPGHFEQFDHPPQVLQRLEQEEQEELQPPQPQPSQPPMPLKSEPVKESKLENAFDFLNKVKSVLPVPSYNQFLNIMKDFKQAKIDIPTTVSNVVELFKDHIDLIEGFKFFLPTNGVSCLNDHLSKLPSANNKGSDIDSLSQQFNTTYLNDNNSNNNSISDNSSLNDAREYIKKVKDTFINEPNVYKNFLNLLSSFSNGQETTSSIYSKIAVLFKDYQYLVDGFSRFLIITDSNVSNNSSK